MPAKNALTAADAKIVEECFRATLSTMHEGGVTDAAFDRPGLADTPDDPAANDGPPDGHVRVLNGQMPNEPPPAVAEQGAVSPSAQHKASERGQERSRGDAMHAWGKTVRLRDKDHRKYVLRQPCLVCGRVPSDPHHLTFTQPRALGRRVSDEFMVPVCRVHHRELHRSGDETAWWRRLNIDPIPVALRLWQQSRADAEIAPRPQGRALKTSKVLAHGQARTSADARIESTRAAQNTTSNGASECGESSIGNRAPA
jgi:hypothetical protein